LQPVATSNAEVSTARQIEAEAVVRLNTPALSHGRTPEHVLEINIMVNA
jgi:hypothetical protein